MRRKRETGFSLLEMVVVLSIILIVSSISVMSVWTAIRNARVGTAYQTTVMQMRRARQAAVDDRRVHVITFTAPGGIRIERIEQDGVTRTMLDQRNLPEDIQFRVEPGIPTDPLLTPDQFGVGGVAIDFNNANEIYFQPDGSALDAAGRLNNGVIYFARPGELESARAVTIFGSTGRVKGWRLTEAAPGDWRWR